MDNILNYLFNVKSKFISECSSFVKFIHKEVTEKELEWRGISSQVIEATDRKLIINERSVFERDVNKINLEKREILVVQNEFDTLRKKGSWRELVSYLQKNEEDLSLVKGLSLDDCKLLIREGGVTDVDFAVRIAEESCDSERLKKELNTLFNTDVVRLNRDNPNKIREWIEAGYIHIDRVDPVMKDSPAEYLFCAGGELQKLAIDYSKESFLKGYKLMKDKKVFTELRGKHELAVTYIAILSESPYISSTGLYELSRRYMQGNPNVKFVILTEDLKNHFGDDMFSQFDGIIMPGGFSGYQEAEISNENYDVAIDGCDLELLERQVWDVRMNLPCLGFCLGLQSIALDHDGTLYECEHELRTTIVYGTVMHFLMCTAEDQIKLLNGEKLKPMVLEKPYYNHSYAVKESGKLVVNAMTEDGVIVGAELGLEALATQFHPEKTQFFPNECSDENGYQLNFLDGVHEQFTRMNRYLQPVRTLERNKEIKPEVIKKAHDLAIKAKQAADNFILDRLKFLREQEAKGKDEVQDLNNEILEKDKNWKPLNEKAFTWDLVDDPILKELEGVVSKLAE